MNDTADTPEEFVSERVSVYLTGEARAALVRLEAKTGKTRSELTRLGLRLAAEQYGIEWPVRVRIQII